MNASNRTRGRWVSSPLVVALAAIAAVGSLVAPREARACATCIPLKSTTLAEDINGSIAAVICRFVARPDAAAVARGAAQESTFEVVEFLNGDAVAIGAKGLAAPVQIKILFFGEQPVGTTFFTYAVNDQGLLWSLPQEVKAREREYLRKLSRLPPKGPARLSAFIEYLEVPELLVSGDAYEEFARAPYADLQGLKAQLPRESLLKWIADVNVSTAHRRQYLSLLSVCATADDVPKIEAMLRSEAATSRVLLDALIGCYLVMRGADGLPLIEQLFLKNKQAELVDANAAIVALRVIASETNAVPRPRINEALRHVLGRPEIADLVINDLARGKDWSVAKQLAALFRNSERDDSQWVRIPIANYLRVCPTEEAIALRKELEVLDPESFQRAAQFYGKTIADVPAKQPNVNSGAQ